MSMSFIREIDTPALLIDLDVAKTNLRRMQEKADHYGVALRPHIKTHKIPELALMQIKTGACGITASKVSEAEVMADAGIGDILIANQIVTETKLQRLTALARNAKISIGIDSAGGAELLSRVFAESGMTLDYLIEIDSGLHRCGVPPGKPARELYDSIRHLPSIRFKGLFTHAGQVYGKGSLDQVKEVSLSESAQLSETGKLFRDGGIKTEVVSVGSTPTMKVWQGHEDITEIRPGNYIFNDAMQVALGVAGSEDCALTVLATVISRPETNRVILDAGSKVFALDKGGHGHETVQGFGVVIGRDAVIERLSEEHGIMRVNPQEDFRIGEQLRIIPNHACAVVNLFEKAYGIRGNRIEKEFAVSARGKVQ